MEGKEYVLRYHFQHSQPVQLSSFLGSLSALNEEYSSFTKQRGEKLIKSGLYLSKVEEGSIICDFVVLLGSGVLPIVESANSLVEFFQNMKRIWDALLGKGSLPDGTTNKSLQHASDILTPVAEDNHSSISFKVIDPKNCTIFQDCQININSQEGNAMQNSASREISSRQSQELSECVYERELLQLQQLNKNKSADLGLIERISPKSVKLLLRDEDKDVLTIEGEDNPFQWFYWVDVKTKIANGKLVAYEVLKVHDKFRNTLD